MTNSPLLVTAILLLVTRLFPAHVVSDTRLVIMSKSSLNTLIKSSAINGESVAFVEHNKLTEEMIKRLTTEGYTVDTYGSESYSIQW